MLNCPSGPLEAEFLIYLPRAFIVSAGLDCGTRKALMGTSRPELGSVALDGLGWDEWHGRNCIEPTKASFRCKKQWSCCRGSVAAYCPTHWKIDVNIRKEIDGTGSHW